MQTKATPASLLEGNLNYQPTKNNEQRATLIPSPLISYPVSEESLKKKTVKGTVWSSIERFSVQGVQFIVMIFMARILTPADYGLVGMLTIFIAVSQSLVDSGFSNALIRKQDLSSVDTSTVFYFNIVVAASLYAILFFCAPFIARFYNQPLLTPLTRYIALSIPLNSFCVVQRSLLSIKVDFKTQTKASLAAACTSGAVGLGMAYSGWGVWALVWSTLSGGVVNLGVLWLLTKWQPALAYSWKSFKEMFGFGSKIAFTGIIYTIYNNIYLLVIGKLFNASELGYYTRANQFAQYPSTNVTGIIQRVSYPVLCSIQDDDIRLGSVYRRYLRLVCFIVFPLMTILAVLSQPFILCILNETWIAAAALLSILCFAFMWSPVHAINLSLLLVKGRSDLYMKLEFIKEGIGLSILAATAPFGIIAMCWGLVLLNIIALIINTHYTGKMINVGFFTQMKDLLPSLTFCLITGVCVYFISWVLPHNVLKLIIGGFAGIIIYILISAVLDAVEYKEIISLIPERFRLKFKKFLPFRS